MLNYKRSIPLIMVCLMLAFAGCSSNNSHHSGQNGTSTNTNQTQPNAPAEEGPISDEQEDVPIEPADPVEDLISTMSVAEKVGQLVIVGVDGITKNEDTQRFIEEYHVGGFIFYKANIESTKQAVQLFNDLKLSNVVNKVPLWMSVDEEGGRVTRMPQEFLRLPTNKVIGQKNDVELSNEIGQILGRELKGFGLNMDFAPVLDIHSNPNNAVIGDRSFGDQAAIVSSLGIATMHGIQSQGVIPVVKHFPGHGDTSVDSHIGLPIVDHSLNRLRELELLPFQEAIKQQAEVVMIAHILIPKLDPDYPASLSKIAISDILRDELGFNGVVITDDMTMGAIVDHYDLQQSSVQSVLAGTNIVLVGHDVEKGIAVIEALTDAVKSGRISEELLNNRVHTILKLKEKYKLSNELAEGPDVQSLNTDIRKILNKVGQGNK